MKIFKIIVEKIRLQKVKRGHLFWDGGSNKDDEQRVFKALISGFIGGLKGWWDTYVSEEEKQIIYNAKKNYYKNKK